MNNQPFNVLRHTRQWERAPRMPQIVAPYIATTLGVSPLVSKVIAYVAYTAVTSVVLNALSPTPDFGASTRGMLVNSSDPAAPHDYVYGEVRKGGVRTYVESTGDTNQYLHMIIAVAGHEIEEYSALYVNDEEVTLDGSGFVTDAKWNGKIRIKKHKGDQTSADADLLAESTEITSDFVGNGIAYLYVRLEYDQDVFSNGIPLFTARVKGRKVVDPRVDTSTRSYSANAALCVRDYLTSDIGLNDPSVYDTAFASSANVSDEDIALAAGGTQKRYEVNGVVSAGLSPRQVMARMMTTCDGTLFWGQGNWQLKVAYYSAPVKTFTLDDLRGPIGIDTRVSARDNFNRVIGTFADADADYITSDYPPLESSAFLAEDDGVENTLSLDLPLTTNFAAAQRLAKLTLFRAREQITVSASFGMEAFGVQVGDIIAFTSDRHGWSAKEFEVVGWTFETNQDAGDMQIGLTLRETSSAAFAWSGEETDIIRNNSNLPDYQSVAQLTNLSLEATAVINNDGIAIPAISASWDVSPNSFVQYYEIQYKRLGGEEDYGSIATAQDAQEQWGLITATATSSEDYGLTNEPILTPDAEYLSVIGTSNGYTIAPVLNGYDYIVRVRAITSIGVRSPWLSSTVESEGDTTPPNEPLNVTAVGAQRSILVEWTNPADQDFSHVEVYANTSDNLASASLIGTTPATNFTHSGLPNNSTRFYWVRAVDYSLNKSDFSSSVTSTTVLISPDDFDDAVNDLFGEAGAFGVEPVSTLPASGGFDGQLVLLLPDITIYRWDATTSAWSTDLYTASAVEAGSIGFASFAAGIEPVGVVDALPTVSGYNGPITVVLTTDGKLYRLVSGAWTAAVNTDDIEGTIGESLFSDGLRPIEVLASLPTTGLTVGRVVMLTTDDKLYRYNGSEWTSSVPAVDLTGQINSGQIADAAITATKIGNDAVTTAALANDAVTSAVIAAGAVTETSIASGAISTPKLQAGAVTASTLAADSVTANAIAANAVTAGAIEAGSITSAEIASNTITAGDIAANAVTASELAADSVTADAISANAVTADAISANAVTADAISAGAISANKLAANSVTASAIAADAVTADSIAANAVTADALAANSVTAGTVAAGAISAAQIQSDAITSDKIFSAAVTADAISSGAIVSDKIAAGAIIASKLAAGAVTANSISADAITGKNVTVGDLTATTVPTGSQKGARIQSNGTMFVGDKNEYLRWDGSVLSINGEIQNLGDFNKSPYSGGWSSFAATKSLTSKFSDLGGAGLYRIFLVGAGGGGSGGGRSGDAIYAKGGSSGTAAYFTLDWDGSSSLNFVSGSGGAGGIDEGNGSNGGSSLFQIGGSTVVTCQGGLGANNSSGSATAGQSAPSAPSNSSISEFVGVAGGAGGSSNSVGAATGGGGVAAFDVSASSCRGGNVTTSYAATAGGGPFGRGLDSSSNGIYSGPSSPEYSTGTTSSTSTITTSPSGYFSGPSGSGPLSKSGFIAGRGALGNGTITAASGGLLAGGGGAVTTADQVATGGDGGSGGGGGGAHKRDFASGDNPIAGDGGSGIIFFKKL